MSKPSRLAALLVAGGLAVLLALSAGLRIEAALGDPNFDAAHPAGLLKSDPALLHYITGRILAANGAVPSDFRADPRIQHPDLTDIPSEFTVGQEFLLAWSYALLAPDEPLHTFAVRFFSVLAASAALGAALLVWTRTRSPAWTLLAAGLFLVLPANHRTIGFILVREDLSFPLFALHLGLLARAERLRTAPSFLFAGLLLGAALATWHALSFFVAIEVGCLFLAFLKTGRSPFEIRGAWAVLIGPIVAATLVPALQVNATLVGLPMQMAWGLLAVALVRMRRPLGRAAALGLGFAGAGLAALLSSLLVPGRSGYAHVREVLLAKLAHLGQRPADPTVLPFDARLLWQGPFETLTPGDLVVHLGWGAGLLILAGLVAWRVRRRLSGFDWWFLLLTLASLPTAWLFGRTVILAGFCVPALVVLVAAREERVRLALGVVAGAVVLQGVALLDLLGEDHRIAWYLPPGRQAEIAGLVRWIDENIDSDEPIAADFMNSTAILAHTGNPIALQPKYETEASRRRAQVFLETFFHGTPEEFRILVRDRFRCTYVLIDRYTLGFMSSWTAGLSSATPLPGTAAAVFLDQDDSALRSVPGFELVFRSPPTIRQINGEPYDFFRLYRLP